PIFFELFEGGHTIDEINAQVAQAKLGVKQADITIENAKLALQLAERDYRNTKGLYADSVATLEQLENAETQLNNARNQLEAAQTGLDFNQKNETIANFNLQHSRIVAPASGTILKKLATASELIGPGNPVFIFGSKEQAQVIRINLTDKDIIHVKLGDKAHIFFDAYPNQAFNGTVVELASMADPFTGTYEVEVQISANGSTLLNGFIGRVELMTQQQQEVLRIPIDAMVSADKNKAQIFVVKDGKAHKTAVEVFEMQGSDLLINKGLETGQQVVVAGAGYLEHGESVRVE
ncbi:MAG: efflux RND transporter periplasmic adaptor subunit, partial [Bacteroidota bacterium]